MVGGQNKALPFHCSPWPVQSCFFSSDTVNLKPDSVDCSCFLLLQFCSKASLEGQGPSYWDTQAKLRRLTGTQHDLLPKLASITFPQGNEAFNFACFLARIVTLKLVYMCVYCLFPHCGHSNRSCHSGFIMPGPSLHTLLLHQPYFKEAWALWPLVP